MVQAQQLRNAPELLVQLVRGDVRLRTTTGCHPRAEQKKKKKEQCGGNQERRPRGVVRANHESHSPASDRGPAEVSLGGMPWSATRGPDPMSPHPTRERRVEVSKEKKRKVGGGSQERRPRGVVRANHESHSPASDRGPAEVSLGGMPWSATRGPDPISPHPTRERRVKAPRRRT